MADMTPIERLYSNLDNYTYVFGPSDLFNGFLKTYTTDGGITVIIRDYEQRAKAGKATKAEVEAYAKIVATCNKYAPTWREALAIDATPSKLIQSRKNIYSSKATYSSYSGTDIVASITLPDFGAKPRVIGELQTISYSIHREVSPVRVLGRANPVGFTAGQRTIAGSLIFTVFNHNIVYDIKEMINNAITSNSLSTNEAKQFNDQKFRTDNIKSEFVVMDEMPPFDVTITFNNEYGGKSGLVIKGIVIVDEGQVMSIEDMLTENTMSYMARDIQVMKKVTT